MRRWGPVAACAVLALGAVASCGDGDGVPGSRRAPTAAIPQKLTVEAADAVLGHTTGTIRQAYESQEFSISKHPITVGNFRQCVTAGVCGAPAQVAKPSVWKGTYSSDVKHASLPMVGATANQAKQYCQWVGGRLPSYPEWQVAARGPSVTKFPWGDAPLSCERHPFLPTPDGAGTYCCDKECELQSVGAHPAGASPSGLEDVLLVPGGELVGPGPNDATAGAMECASACVARAFEKGAPRADVLVPPGQDADFGFRCAWEE